MNATEGASGGHDPIVIGQLKLRLQLRYFTSLKIVIGADGDVAPAELNAPLDEMRQLGAPQSLIDEFAGRDVSGTKIEDWLPFDASESHVRMLLYDAIRISWTDDVDHPDEEDAVHEVADRLRVDIAMARAIEGLVRMERSVQKMRHALFCRTD